MTTNRSAARRRTTLRLTFAGLALAGIGAAITTAVWTDDVFFSATATSSSFDLQNAAEPTGPWSDAGLPGDDAVVTITAAGLDALSPNTTINVPFYLCNVGTTAGTVTAVSPPVIGGTLNGAVGLTVTVTAPTVSTALPSDPTCATPVVGNLQVVTDGTFVAQGATGDITFNVTGTSN